MMEVLILKEDFGLGEVDKVAASYGPGKCCITFTCL